MSQTKTRVLHSVLIVYVYHKMFTFIVNLFSILLRTAIVEHQKHFLNDIYTMSRCNLLHNLFLRSIHYTFKSKMDFIINNNKITNLTEQYNKLSFLLLTAQSIDGISILYLE